jgi:hypothetical protein
VAEEALSPAIYLKSLHLRTHLPHPLPSSPLHPLLQNLRFYSCSPLRVSTPQFKHFCHFTLGPQAFRALFPSPPSSSFVPLSPKDSFRGRDVETNRFLELNSGTAV